MSRRAKTLIASGLLLFLLIAWATLLPVPYVVFSPGSTANTLGDADGKALVSISGHATYPTKGQLLLTTVLVRGGPGTPHVSVFEGLAAWLNSSDAVLPEEAVFPNHPSAAEARKESAAEMTGSQQAATAAALHLLDIPYDVTLTVKEIVKGAPSSGVLRVDDAIVKVDGRQVETLGDLRKMIGAHAPGDTVPFVVRRAGKDLALDVPTEKAPDGRTVVGIDAAPSNYQFPFKVSYALDQVGGPSAGTMFALGIVDKLTPGPLTGGLTIAGTGTIDPDGEVGAIGGIAQKMRGALHSKATVFLAPGANCAEALAAVPHGLRLVRIDTLAGARDAVTKLASGATDVPTCKA